MAKRILIALDVTTAAEGLVPLAGDTAHSAGATVRLLHVAAPPDNVYSDEGRVVVYAHQEMDRLETEGRERLEALGQAYLAGVPFEAAVRFGDPADEILAEIDAFGADLVVVGTTTRSSLKRALLGSVAETLIQEAPVTVMLIRPMA